ncbi:hypothetical protein GE21DRAFT_9123 [Neurospora crassa]|uniref:Uncharacterized protein n=2 Tax=Neurospora crassa TaxID=5141 RepID=F5HED5_NEUCR|nr:hypothetical protein NCU03904 [Neurospora crassa OR74A]EAA28307.2 hypothetical protein NCU03904 [Neurospora crassa OR74A]KAK3503536.1 hypothetical protein B0T13DRAFT_133687 [Neurospora crassa]KHE80068.1 hypothetical protein GE21DRAFT_9123 [Neurospora crassa]CAB91680.2 putative protein [Neurospora crassa]|eukprot:XP_957543.2 hypothetical protein NCU03904 [Neurospora crassa OR74A]
MSSSDTTTSNIPNASMPAQDKKEHEHESSSHQRPTGAGVNTGAGSSRPKTEAELEADRLYEERMEEEYAKRDGGA